MSASVEATTAIALIEEDFGNSAQIELLLERVSICLNASTLPAMASSINESTSYWARLRTDTAMQSGSDLLLPARSQLRDIIETRGPKGPDCQCARR